VKRNGPLPSDRGNSSGIRPITDASLRCREALATLNAFGSPDRTEKGEYLCRFSLLPN
jgi:hypothetical protein